MKKVFLLLAALVFLALCGCDSAPEGSAPPSPEPSPSQAADSPLPETPPPPSEEPSSEEPQPSLGPLEELLARQIVDDDHDAFLVPTGGRLGTLLVTVEREKQTQQDYLVRFAVWDPADMSQPLQRMEKTAMNVLRLDKKMDVNFDGYMDFSYTYAMGVQAELNYLWLWDEKAGRFVEEPEYSTISSPQINSETQVIEGWNRSSAAGDGVTTFHHWEEGKLVCVRRIELELTDWSEDDSLWLLTVQDRIDGKLIEVFRMECPWDSNDCWDEREKWSDLDYHGEGLDPEELLARQTVDDGHDAFLVPTGGRLGTLLVTAERGGWNTDGTFGWYDTTLSVWDPQDMDAPLQTIKTRMQGPFDIMLKMEDVNFDGYMDLEFLCIQYVRSLAFQLWLWDEEAGQFVEEPSFIEILDPWVDPESETVIGGTWETWNVRAQTVHRWEDGKLVFVREVKHIYPDPDVAQDEEEVVVYEYVDGELVEVSRGPG